MPTESTPRIEGDPQDNFVENRDPTELAMCLILGAAYLGLAKYCWLPLLLAHNWRLLFNVEGFFICISCLSIVVGLRPYLNPSNLQVSGIGIKYRGPYWPQRKTLNWDQVTDIYLSSELVIIMYYPKPDSKRPWPILIPSIYLADRERLIHAVIKYSPVKPIMMTSPALVSRLAFGILFFITVVWVLEMLLASG